MFRDIVSQNAKALYAPSHWETYLADTSDQNIAEIPSAASRSVYGTNSKCIGAECSTPPLKFGEMVHSNIKQITMKMGMLGKILRVPRNF